MKEASSFGFKERSEGKFIVIENWIDKIYMFYVWKCKEAQVERERDISPIHNAVLYNP